MTLVKANFVKKKKNMTLALTWPSHRYIYIDTYVYAYRNWTGAGGPVGSFHVPVLVRRHLGQAEHRVLAAQAVIVRLLAGVHATARLAARLRRRELLEARGHDRVQLLVLAPVRHHLVGVRAHELALQTVEVRRLVLLPGACNVRTVVRGHCVWVTITCVVRGRNALNVVRGYVSRHAVDRTRFDLVYEMFQKRRRTTTIFFPHKLHRKRIGRTTKSNRRVAQSRLPTAGKRRPCTDRTVAVYWPAEIAK